MVSNATRCRIVLIGGSLRAGSTNAAVLDTAHAVAPSGIETVLYPGMGELPHFNPDDETDALPPAVARLRATLAQADAVLFSTPEYAGSLLGSFKNLLDWTVGEGLYRKPVGFINASGHGGAQGAHDTLRKVLGYVSADIVETACLQLPVRRDAIDADGLIADEAVRAGLVAALEALAEHIARLRADVRH